MLDKLESFYYNRNCKSKVAKRQYKTDPLKWLNFEGCVSYYLIAIVIVTQG